MGTSDRLPTPAFGRVDYESHLVVEVRNRFDGSWSHGFEIVESPEIDGTTRFRLRRLSDGVVLPELFRAEDIVVRGSEPPRARP